MIPKKDLLKAELELDIDSLFDPDAPSGEPVLKQIRDPFTDSVHCPGLEVKYDGEVEFRW